MDDNRALKLKNGTAPYAELRLPNVSKEKRKIRAAAVTGVIVSFGLVGLVMLANYDPVVSRIGTLFTEARESIWFDLLVTETPWIAVGLIVLHASFNCMVAYFRFQKTLDDYLERMQTAFTVAFQICNADGVRDPEKRALATQILWQGQNNRWHDIIGLIMARMQAISIVSAPWVVLLAAALLLGIGNVVAICAAVTAYLTPRLVEAVVIYQQNASLLSFDRDQIPGVLEELQVLHEEGARTALAGAPNG